MRGHEEEGECGRQPGTGWLGVGCWDWVAGSVLLVLAVSGWGALWGQECGGNIGTTKAKEEAENLPKRSEEAEEFSVATQNSSA